MDKSSVEPTIFFIEKISFSLKLFSGHFYGQSFIETVRGPFTKELYENYRKMLIFLKLLCKIVSYSTLTLNIEI